MRERDSRSTTAILSDRREDPVFPRWSGYYNLWTALAFCGGSFAVFFKDGPLAWNGILAFYIPLATFCLWLLLMSALMLRATAKADPTPPLGTRLKRVTG